MGLPGIQANSNNALDLLNIIMGLLSIGVIGVSAWLATKARADCLSFLQWPFIVVGLLIFAVSLLGLFASCRRRKGLLLVYLSLLILIFLLFMAFTLFALVVTKQNSSGRRVPEAHFREYRTTDFSPWLQNKVSQSNWREIQRCLSTGHLCSDLDLRYQTLTQLYSANLSPTEVGCCKPPSICGYNFVSPTTWIYPQFPEASSDCSSWSNDPAELCLECDSCRAGELRVVRQHWLKVAIVSFVVLVLVIAMLILTCGLLYNVGKKATPDEMPVKNPFM